MSCFISNESKHEVVKMVLRHVPWRGHKPGYVPYAFPPNNILVSPAHNRAWHKSMFTLEPIPWFVYDFNVPTEIYQFAFLKQNGDIWYIRDNGSKQIKEWTWGDQWTLPPQTNAYWAVVVSLYKSGNTYTLKPVESVIISWDWRL